MRNQHPPGLHVPRPSFARRLLWAVVGVLLLAPLLYLAAAVVLGAIPLNRDWL